MTKFQKKLSQLKEQNRFRSLSLPAGLDLTSNDYLGMRSHPRLREVALAAIDSGIDFGAAGSRLLRGHCAEHQALEIFAADYFKCEKTLYFSSGFQANYALFTTLPDRHDVIIFDELVHASARDGIQASHAKSIKAKHNDLNAFEDAIQKARSDGAHNIWLAVESLYSMDGDVAPVSDFVNLAKEYDAYLILDEAHASGVLGEDGRGLGADYQHERLITLHTCGKAMGVAGGIVCGSEEIVSYMINAARGFIYSTAPPPLQALLVQKSLEILASSDGQKRRDHLADLCGYVQGELGGEGTHVVPILIGDDGRAVEVSEALKNKGYDIRAIRPPTVAEGTARLRLSLSSDLKLVDLEGFVDALGDIVQI